MPKQALLLLVTLLATLIALSHCSGSSTWCNGQDSTRCSHRDGHGAAAVVVEEAATVSTANEEDEEVVLTYEKEETETLRRHRSWGISENIRRIVGRVKEYKRKIKNNQLCASNCRWINMGDIACEKCNYPWALYEPSEGFDGQCITSSNMWGIMEKNPAAVDKYISLCKSNGQCKCNTRNWKNYCIIPCDVLVRPKRKFMRKRSKKLRVVLEKSVFKGGVCPHFFSIYGNSIFRSPKITALRTSPSIFRLPKITARRTSPSLPEDIRKGLVSLCKYQMEKETEGKVKFLIQPKNDPFNHLRTKVVAKKIGWSGPAFLRNAKKKAIENARKNKIAQ